MPSCLEQLDRALLNRIQIGVPLVVRPFEEIGRELGADEAEVLEHVRALKAPPQPVIRQISAIFDSRTLGYESSLVAARVPDDRLDAAVRVVNAHPGVSHNYRRNSEYNLWYTVAVPPHSRLGLEGTVNILHERSGAVATRLMPSLRMYKIGVRFDLSGEVDPSARSESHGVKDHNGTVARVSEQDQRLIRVLQQDLPLVERPFDGWAQSAGVSVDELLAAARRYQQGGWMRRFSAVLRHRAAGFGANAMGVWAVPAGQEDAFGAAAATFDAVSHCYRRPTYPDWRFNLYTMVHAATPQECEQTLAAISRATGVRDFGALFSSHEYKKSRVQYFCGDIEAWEDQALTDQALTDQPAPCGAE